MKRDRLDEIVAERMKKSAAYRKAYYHALLQIDMALLVREMRDAAGFSQAELARRAGTTQSVIARLEDADYRGHSLRMLERIAKACRVKLRLTAERKPGLMREVVLV